MTTLKLTGELYGPELPEGVLPEGMEWHPQTIALWEALRRSPILADETMVGWQFLIDTAFMHTVLWDRGKWEYASEIRLRLAKVGATLEDRMRLKVKVKSQTESTAQTGGNSVANISSRRARLTGS